MLQEILIPNFKNSAGNRQDVTVYYQVFGRKLGHGPVVLVNHALTGNAEVSGEGGWWKELVGEGRCINTNIFTVLCLNIPGNGAGGKKDVFYNYKDFTLADIARIYARVLDKLEIRSLFAAIGGSIGGALAWQLAALKPHLIKNLIPIATDLKATDWLLAHCKVQEQILENSAEPLRDARMHAMTFYRHPLSLSEKFRRKKNSDNGRFEVENWLEHHGRKLESRFELQAYKFMNHLLTTIDISGCVAEASVVATDIESNIHLVSIDSDLFFFPQEIRETYRQLSEVKENISYSEIISIHGHDAFLIEFEQLENILNPIFKFETIKHEKDKLSPVWDR